MKKLLILLMIFTLVGCDSKKIEEQPVDAPIADVVEPKVDEPIVGGYIDVEDKTLTDELKDIFNTALKGLMGASYEPVELVATQVVAGTNYKFLANGTKTTNPVTKGTYYITIYKDLEGNVELLDIETIEEYSATPTKEKTQMSFWVVFYDQYGNELQRQTLKYGTIPSYTDTLPEGFVSWDKQLKAITGNTYIHAVCNTVSENVEVITGPCPYIQEALVYIEKVYDYNDDYYLIDVFEYENDSYEYVELEAIPISIFNGHSVGDWIHCEMSHGFPIIGKCNHNGDGAIVPAHDCFEREKEGEYLINIVGIHDFGNFDVIMYQYDTTKASYVWKENTYLYKTSFPESAKVGDWWHMGKAYYELCLDIENHTVIPEPICDITGDENNYLVHLGDLSYEGNFYIVEKHDYDSVNKVWIPTGSTVHANHSQFTNVTIDDSNERSYIGRYAHAHKDGDNITYEICSDNHRFGIRQN